MNEDLKKQLRLKIKKERADIIKSDKNQLDMKIADNLIKSGILDTSKLVLVYLSTDIEVGTEHIISHCLENSIKMAVPRCVGPRKMNFYLYDKNTKLEKSKFGIYEPYEDDEKKVTSFENAICIVPGLSFDKKGYRLGYGGGFYDTLLSDNKKMTTVGICYSCHISDELPKGIYDKNVKFIITENNMEVCDG